MRTALVTMSYLEGVDSQGNDMKERLKRFLNYYHNLDLGFDELVIFDNCSKVRSLSSLSFDGTFTNQGKDNRCTVWKSAIFDEVTLFRFEEHLRRLDVADGYIYCWRAVYALRSLFAGYDKIIFIDSDAYVLSRRLINFMRTCNQGFQSFWCPRHGFPESSLFIINKDAYPIFEKYCDELSYEDRAWRSTRMETSLPFTRVSHDFNIDRFGEDNPTPDQSREMDAYLQANLKTKFHFNPWL